MIYFTCGTKWMFETCRFAFAYHKMAQVLERLGNNKEAELVYAGAERLGYQE
jgi:hypothetical protein